MAAAVMSIGRRSKLFLSIIRRLIYAPTRNAGHLIPPDQYDTPVSKKFQLTHALTTHWETIPLFATSLASIGLVFYAIVWSINNKVDVVFKARSQNNISRTMDLNYPTIHKFITIDQIYKPWPKLQKIIDKMKKEEDRRRTKCVCKEKTPSCRVVMSRK